MKTPSDADETETVTPGNEMPVDGPDADRVRSALDRLAARPQKDPATGRFVQGTQAATTTGERSMAFWSAVQEVKADVIARVRSGLDTSTAAEPLTGLIDAYAEVYLFRTAMFQRLVELGGPITTKGRARQLYASYLSALDRETKLAQLLGLRREPQPVRPLAEVLNDG